MSPVKKGGITQKALTDFLFMHGIDHSVKVVFEREHYTVYTYRRDENGKYTLSQDHPGNPIEDVEVFSYGD